MVGRFGCHQCKHQLRHAHRHSQLQKQETLIRLYAATNEGYSIEARDYGLRQYSELQKQTTCWRSALHPAQLQSSRLPSLRTPLQVMQLPWAPLLSRTSELLCQLWLQLLTLSLRVQWFVIEAQETQCRYHWPPIASNSFSLAWPDRLVYEYREWSGRAWLQAGDRCF